jgi:hypothetical protein
MGRPPQEGGSFASELSREVRTCIRNGFRGIIRGLLGSSSYTCWSYKFHPSVQLTRKTGRNRTPQLSWTIISWSPPLCYVEDICQGAVTYYILYHYYLSPSAGCVISIITQHTAGSLNISIHRISVIWLIHVSTCSITIPCYRSWTTAIHLIGWENLCCYSK